MARGTLHAPKPDDMRRRRNAPTHAETVLPRDDVVRGPELDKLVPGRQFRPETIAWYEDWRRSPQAAVFEITDWRRLAALALAYDKYVQRPTAALLAEIRMSEERLGATFVDRMRARMRIEDDDDRDAAPVLRLVDARRELRRQMSAAGE